MRTSSRSANPTAPAALLLLTVASLLVNGPLPTAVAAALALGLLLLPQPRGIRRAPAVTSRTLVLLRTASVAALAVLTLIAALRGAGRLKDLRQALPDRGNEPALAAAAEGQEMLLTGSDLHLIQLRTRCPVLLDGGGLDGLVYAPGAGPALERILREVYGLDLFHPPDAIRRERPGAIPPQLTKDLWEARSTADWQRIRREFGVARVVTYPDWKLDLPLLARSSEFAVYRIP